MDGGDPLGVPSSDEWGDEWGDVSNKPAEELVNIVADLRGKIGSRDVALKEMKAKVKVRFNPAVVRV